MVVVVVVCLFFGPLFINGFSLGVFGNFRLCSFVSKFSVRVLLLCGWNRHQHCAFWRFEQCLREVQKITPRSDSDSDLSVS